MYAVVGCNACSNLWLVEGRQQTAQCSRCGKTHQFDRLKKFAETDDEDHARELRASMLANRSDHGDAFAAVDSFSELENEIDDAGVSDREYLEGSGLDADEIADAGASTNEQAGSSGTRKETVLDAIRTLDEPTESAVIDYATEHDVPADYVTRCLDKLAQQGEISQSASGYRLL